MPAHFSSRTEWPKDENALTQKLKALRAEGHEILDLTESNPTRCGFQFLSGEILKPFSNSGALIYDPLPQGLESARKAVQNYYAARGVEIDLKQIFLTASTSEAYHFLFRLLANPGDAVLVPKPGYPLLEYLGALNDVTVSPFALDPAAGWGIDVKNLKRAASPKACAMLLVHPNNPTGHYVSSGDRELVNRFCRERDLALMVDEVFLDYAWNPSEEAPRSFAANGEVLTFTLSGVSKILGLPQMKLSWVVVSGPEQEREEAIRRLEVIADAYLSVNTPVQRALPEWMAACSRINGEIAARVKENFKILQANPEFSRLGGLVPEGGWYALLNLPETRTDEDWALYVLVAEHVLFHPGYLFDFEDKDRAVVSLLPEPVKFQEGIKRLLRRLD